MDLRADEVIENLFSGKAFEVPTDDCKPNEIEMQLPTWYDKEKFKRGQKFFHQNIFTLFITMMAGLVTVLAVPSILSVLIATKRSSSPYTAYKRYVSTMLHTVSWFEHPLEPGSVSWRSLQAVRTRHLRASIQTRRRSTSAPDGITQRDLAFTMFGFMGYSVTKGKLLNIVQIDEATLEDMTHVWAVIGYMIGLKDEFNICRLKIEDTRKVCLEVNRRVCAPCLQNVPENFIHMTDSLLDGMWSFNPNVMYNSFMYFTRYIAEVPGYVYTKKERLKYKEKLLSMKDIKYDESTAKPSQEKSALPKLRQPKHNPEDFDSLSTVPAYKQLSFYEKYKLDLLFTVQNYLVNTYWGRIYLNFQIRYSLWLIKYIPFLAYFRFGFIKSYVNMFKESEMDNTIVKKNCEMVPTPAWYESFLPFKYTSDYLAKQM